VRGVAEREEAGGWKSFRALFSFGRFSLGRFAFGRAVEALRDDSGRVLFPRGAVLLRLGGVDARLLAPAERLPPAPPRTTASLGAIFGG
jgi:hypothetical protein